MTGVDNTVPFWHHHKGKHHHGPQGRAEPQPAPARPVQVVDSSPQIQKVDVVASPNPVFEYSICEHSRIEPSSFPKTQNDMV